MGSGSAHGYKRPVWGLSKSSPAMGKGHERVTRIPRGVHPLCIVDCPKGKSLEPHQCLEHTSDTRSASLSRLGRSDALEPLEPFSRSRILRIAVFVHLGIWHLASRPGRQTHGKAPKSHGPICLIRPTSFAAQLISVTSSLPDDAILSSLCNFRKRPSRFLLDRWKRAPGPMTLLPASFRQRCDAEVGSPSFVSLE